MQMDGIASFSGTRREGSVDCIAELPNLINAAAEGRFN